MVEVWLSYNNNEDNIRLPIVPETIQLTQGKNNKTINIYELGEIGLIGKSKLSTLQLDSFYPSQVYGSCQYFDFPDVSIFLDLIQKWLLAEKPIRVIIASETFNLNIAMMIEDFTHGIVDGTTDIKYSLSLVEYPFIKIQRNSTNANNNSNDKGITNTPKNRPISRQVKDTHIILPDDDLWEICKRNFGSGSRWREVALLNGITDPTNLPVGKEIRLFDATSIREGQTPVINSEFRRGIIG